MPFFPHLCPGTKGPCQTTGSRSGFAANMKKETALAAVRTKSPQMLTGKPSPSSSSTTTTRTRTRRRRRREPATKRIKQQDTCEPLSMLLHQSLTSICERSQSQTLFYHRTPQPTHPTPATKAGKKQQNSRRKKLQNAAIRKLQNCH